MRDGLRTGRFSGSGLISVHQVMTALGQDRVPYIASCLELARIHRLLILPRGKTQSCVSALSRLAPFTSSDACQWDPAALVTVYPCGYTAGHARMPCAQMGALSDRDHSLVAVVEDHAARIPGRVGNRVRVRVPHTHVLPGGDAHELVRVVVAVHGDGAMRRCSGFQDLTRPNGNKPDARYT